MDFDIMEIFVSEVAANAFRVGVLYSWLTFLFVVLAMSLGISIISISNKRKSRPSA